MATAMIGLVSFQWYWIDSLVEVNQDRFRRDVQQALNNVADKLERQEAMLVAFDNFNSNIKFRSATPIAPGNVAYIESTYKKWEVKEEQAPEVRAFDMHKRLPVGFQYHFESANGEKIIILDDSSTVIFPEGDPGAYTASFAFSGGPGDSLRFSAGHYRQTMEKATQKTEMIQVALHELLFEKRNIGSRINTKQLDSLLLAELKNKGIETEFDYGVVDEATGTVVLASKKDTPGHISHTEFKASLFPNDLLGDGSTLVVSFPNQKSFLLQKIWTSMASSAVLIVTIILCFSYAIQTIIRQKKISEVKNDFINNMTHEFKTPISTVALACEALQDDDITLKPDIHKRYLRIIADENKRLGLQVEKVLQMAALDKKDFKLKLEAVDVHKVIEKAIDNIALQVQKKDGVIVPQLLARRPVLMADQMHLTNIVHNLLDNANKYTPDSPEIVVQTRDDHKGIVIAIHDNGIGMSKESIQKIFDRFYRVPTGNLHDVKGFGLGLAYVKTMVEAHAGTITVKSELKRGSTFEIYLPYGNET